MVSSAEMDFFGECAARYVGKDGAIVDLGCWFGATSVSLAKGIRSVKGDHSNERVLAFDRFVWEEWMPTQEAYCVYQAGESFLPEARRIALDYGGGFVELIPADLALYEWSAEPIKILLVDAMKSANIAQQIAKTFFPSLRIGSLLIHQDFKHYFTSWIHLLQYRLRQYFQVYRDVLSTGTVAFELAAVIPMAAVELATDLNKATDNEIDTSFRYSIDLVGSGEGLNIAAAHVMHYVHLGRKDRALEVFERYRSMGFAEKGEFPKMLNCLNQMR
jgi:hypothetical protein